MDSTHKTAVVTPQTATKRADEVVQWDDPETERNEVDIRSSSWRGCCLRSMLPFAIYYSFVYLTTQALASYLTSQITTIEKQFGLSSSQSGVLLGMNDAGYLVMVIFASYIGRNSYIPRVLSVCCCLYGVSALICASPYFFTDHSLNYGSNASTNSTSSAEGRLCSTSSLPPDTGECSSDQKTFYSSAKSVAMAVISTGMFLQGMAKAPRVPLLETYIDDNVPKTKSGFYIGQSICMYACLFTFGILLTLLGRLQYLFGRNFRRWIRTDLKDHRHRDCVNHHLNKNSPKVLGCAFQTNR